MTDRTAGGVGRGLRRRLERAGFSVRARITTGVAILVALALGGTWLLVYALGMDRVDDTIRSSADQELAELAEFEEVGVDPGTGGSFTTLDRLVETFLQRNVPAPSEIMLGVWDGQVQMASASDRAELRRDQAFLGAVLPRVQEGGSGEVATSLGDVYYEVLPLRDAERTGAFVVAYFLEDERQALHAMLRSFAVAASLALIAVVALAAFQAGRLLAPLRVLRETAEEISETDLSRRIPVSGNDDLTALTQTVNAMLERLENAFAGQRAFLDDAGHELRTPLTILRGHLELVDTDDADDVSRTRDLLLDEVDRMARLVEDMILLTKADRPGFLALEPVEVEVLLADVAEKVRGLGDRAWWVDGGATGLLEVDEQRVTQALLQLAHNAVKHTAAGDRVGLGADEQGPDVLLWVEDSGPGVPDSDKETIFRRFSRGAEESDHEGTGLGLSIVAAIAHAHGGSVHVEDAEPHGARFVLTLPRRTKEAPWPAS